MKRVKYLAKILVMFYIVEILLMPFSSASYADDEDIIQHTPLTCVTVNSPVPLSATIGSSKVEKDARVYFRVQGAPSLYFVRMQHVQDQTYTAMLPSPVDTDIVIEYFFQ